ncbi:cupin domain-containing protein [bacterium (Candidatus Blackallbacteria) CG17_big_fil_post_rev_8_21_14_2_50_48_46]|uniref:Cupin domain-containing protein n=1 Tax=bacterium (Candidatus Blackallbacteria) CG17_big_fil_post_rev_8_21_14_2_50_48_46 TaxID=2014261 RepID=A0A2M7G041_9BACT|nr:MAG: cupin [bacterium (Candidatus Blackallbacteria) CG18_big_fil_WC_8_21_14_2_50_49_26]PIW15056.1 MAG: cupin domain-containing protein [bacterium (Candidatus Blackallbacteria) CG17_big_fil_post_rev_8_21_14_2_50_48_46]PIW47621.1 MAG: cupin domain-containing protein [bacterium (Candidatus Blackallbacteria) CG13_big_fil_rev_8_21_14_2_50_49_14]
MKSFKRISLLSAMFLALSLSTGMALAETQSQAHAESIQAQIEYNPEKPAKKILFSTPQYELILFAFDAGQGLKGHSVPFSAYIQVIEGEGILMLEDKAIVMKAGEGFTLPAGVPHSVKAPARFKMLLLKQAGKL